VGAVGGVEVDCGWTKYHVCTARLDFDSPISGIDTVSMLESLGIDSYRSLGYLAIYLAIHSLKVRALGLKISDRLL
jgi:hypothetical protein